MVFHETTVIGHLGRDPEMRYTASGAPVTNISVAAGENWTDQQGKKQERTIWYRAACWRNLAETVNKWCKKGQLVMVKGQLKEPEPYKGRDGEWRCNLEMTAFTVKFLTGGRTREEVNGQGDEQKARSKSEPITEEDIPF